MQIGLPGRFPRAAGPLLTSSMQQARPTLSGRHFSKDSPAPATYTRGEAIIVAPEDLTMRRALILGSLAVLLALGTLLLFKSSSARSEERRVGKECRL